MKEVYVLGLPFTVDPARDAYNKYRLLFQNKADQAQEHFYQLYQKNRSLDDVVRNVPNQMKQSIYPAIESCIEILLEHNVLTVDAERFLSQYYEVQEIWEEAFHQIYDQYAEITMDEKALDEYRVARRQGRARWSGGGFGVSGALKGAATAGALNMATGAGHMLVNGVGKAISSASAASKKNKIYRNSKTYSCLARGVWNSTFVLHFALIDCLNQNNADPLPFEGAITEENEKTAAAILNNAKLMKNEEQRRSAFLQSFQLDPYQEGWYSTVLEEFGDRDGSLEAVARYFGISVVEQEKIRCLDAFAREQPLSTEEDAKEAARKVQELRENLHYFDDTEATRAILDAVEWFDQEYRTVDGIVFDSREDADIARTDLNAIQEIESGIDYGVLSSIADAEKKINVYHSPVAEKRQKELHEKWVKLDVQLRTVDTLLPDGSSICCKTYQQADDLRPIVDSLKERLDACGNQDESALWSLKSQLSEWNIPSELASCYQNEIDRRLNTIDQSIRTVLGKEYTTREAAKAAEEQYSQIKESFKTGNPRKNGAKIRERIEKADFSESTQKALENELFQYENAKELKTAQILTRISTAILLIITIGSYFFQLSGTSAFAQKDVTVMGVSLMISDVQIDNHLTFADGIKNGFVVFGRCMGDIFVDGFWDYLDGFDHGLIGNILWAFLGIMWVIIKQCIILIPRYLVSLIITFFQKASLSYYLGYIIGSGIPLGVSQFSFDEDTPEENVQRIKSWKK
ncbi:MAG: hypothetical protein IJ955_08495 [Oscillospiraceae bacterium]|nr:hypothetical protein [Oscillospiraceae bacterium]